jgi:Cu2+-exporting ATPase
MSYVASVETPSERAPPARGGRAARVCRHCGALSPEAEFCCSGCAYVYRLVHAEGLQDYYHLKDSVIPPADTALLPARDYGWLRAAQDRAEGSENDRTPELQLDVQGISCAGCVWLIERIFQKQPGAGRIDVNAQTGQLRMLWLRGEFDATAFARTLQSFNYLLGPASAQRSAHPESRSLIRRIGLCAAFSMNVMLFTLPTYFGMEASFAYARLFGTLSFAFGTLGLFVGGGYFLDKAARALRVGAMNIDLPIALGIIGAYSGSLYGWLVGDERFVYFDFVSTFILLMLVGRWAQTAAIERNQRRLLAQQPTPTAVQVLGADGSWRECGPEQLSTGQAFAVPSGQIVPVESRLLTDEANFNLAWINGEAEPRLVRAGQVVPAGAINATRGLVRCEARQPWAKSVLAELLRPSERAGFRHLFLERVIRGYLIAIVVIAAGAGIGWWLATGDMLRTGSVVTAILVVSCPCAIGLAFPLADEMAAVGLRKRGVFVRAGDLWPRLARVARIVFDKTGTLTLETPILKNPEVLKELDSEACQALHALVADNPHPIARCVHEELLALGDASAASGPVHEQVGWGVLLESGGHRWTLGRPGWKGTAGAAPAGAPEIDTEFARDGLALAHLRFHEKVRSGARTEIASLRARGLGIFILSGDREEKVSALASQLGLAPDCGVAQLSPQQKAEWLKTHDAGAALMLGDGANDSLAFDQALCRGTPVVHRGVLEQKADFYYLGRGIGGVRALFEVNDARRRTHGQLLAFSVAYNLSAVGLACAGHMSPLLAAILMPLSSLATLAIVVTGMGGACRAGRGEVEKPVEPVFPDPSGAIAARQSAGRDFDEDK